MKRLFKHLFVILIILPALIACGGSTQAQQSNDGRHPEWSYNAVIYEINTRQFTPEGTFKAAEQHLDRLKDLGVDILWFMPIQKIGIKERKGELGSYYSILDYTSVNPEFGNIDDFKSFVATAHNKGFKVILDWVANHTSRDAVWLEQGHDDWYVYNEEGELEAPFDWSDVAKLDYDNADMREAMSLAMLYWIEEIGLDGFRCDVASEVPTDFWESVVPKLKQIKPDLFMLAEAEATDLHDKAFDMTYGWKQHSVMNEIAKEGGNAQTMREYLEWHNGEYSESSILMLFTSNHDENSWNGTEFERMGTSARTFAALTYVLPGMPLIYNGQEVGFDRRLEFFVKDQIDWDGDNSFTDFYKTLNALRHSNKALRSPEKGAPFSELENDNAEAVLSFKRSQDGNDILCIFNLTDQTAEVVVETPGLEGDYTNAITGENAAIGQQNAFTLAPWQYYILTR